MTSHRGFTVHNSRWHSSILLDRDWRVRVWWQVTLRCKGVDQSLRVPSSPSYYMPAYSVFLNTVFFNTTFMWIWTFTGGTCSRDTKIKSGLLWLYPAHYNEFLFWCEANVIRRYLRGPHSFVSKSDLFWHSLSVNLRWHKPTLSGRGGLLDFCRFAQSYTFNFNHWIYKCI